VAYEALLQNEDCNGLARWLDVSGELLIQLEFPGMHGTGDWWLVSALSQLTDLLASVAWPQLELSVYRQPQLPLRGLVTADLTRDALRLVPDGTWYAIRELAGTGPAFCRFLSDGNSHTDLDRDLTRLVGQGVAIGLHPEESGLPIRGARPHHRPDELFSLSVRSNRRWLHDVAPAPPPPNSWSAYEGGVLPFLNNRD
jgi:hypothetical protein